MERLATRLEDPEVGAALHGLVAEILPMRRSITGPGVRQTLAHLGRGIDLRVTEVPSGTPVFDWTIPHEWTLREAWIKGPDGLRVVDVDRHGLHVVGYSQPVRTRLSLAALKQHVFTLPGQPDLIPYRTSYYARTWGFCMADSVLRDLPEGEYEVCIDADLAPGALTYGEYLHRGRSETEVLLSTHICHPAMANDNGSGLALLAHLAARISTMETRLSYRFLFAPGTIGAIAWLARNEDRLGRIRHGLVVSGVGDAGAPTYKKSRRGDAAIDRAMTHVLHGGGGSVIDFIPYGYDERQFCSPGIDLPVGSLQRSPYGSYPEYHTSGDDLSFVTPRHLADSWRIVTRALDVLEHDDRPVSRNPKGEPQLGRRGLYTAIGGDPDAPARSMAMLWVLNMADGDHSLLDIAERAGLSFGLVADTARMLADHGLVDLPNDQASARKGGRARSLSEITASGSGQAMASAGSS